MDERANMTEAPPGLAFRVKGVATTRPIHDLEANKRVWPGNWWDRYDLVALAIATIDHVAVEMGVTSAATLDEVTAYCSRQAARQGRTGDSSEHEAVARRVVQGLVTDQPFAHIWVDDTGTTREYEFRLLYEEFRVDGEIVVRATPAAINVLVDAFGDDVESAQAASEAQMRELIKRGALEQAARAATTSRLLTASYIETVVTVTRDTLLDPDSVDWIDDVPATLAKALAHVAERVGIEREIAGEVESRRDASDDPDVRVHANRTIGRLRECIRLHGELQVHLLTVRDSLRTAQDERFRQPAAAASRFTPDVMLDALLRLPLKQTDGPSEAVFAQIAGIAAPWLGNMASLLDDLSEVRQADEPGEIEPEPEFDDPILLDVWAPYWSAADRLVNEVSEPAAVSVLAARAGATSLTLGLDAELFVSAVCHRAYERLAEQFETLPAGSPVVVAVPTGDRVDDEYVYGDAVVVVPAIWGEAAEPEDSW